MKHEMMEISTEGETITNQILRNALGRSGLTCSQLKMVPTNLAKISKYLEQIQK